MKVLLVWELTPHSSHDWLSIVRCRLEAGVEVVNQIVSTVDSISDYGLNSVSLKPWLSLLIVDMAMSSEERIVHAQLVKHDVQFFSNVSKEARYISAAEWNSSIAKLQDHRQGAFKLREDRSVIASPISSILL